MIYIYRLKTVPFFCLFTREEDIEYTGCENTEQNTKAKG